MPSYLADINVWVAIAHQAHVHHEPARDWFHSLGPDELFLCRLTQMGLLRLLTNHHVLGDQVKSQTEAWKVLDEFCRNARVQYIDEPGGVTGVFRQLTQGQLPSSKAWPDAYLGAVAVRSGLTVATFDKDFPTLGVPALLLG